MRPLWFLIVLSVSACAHRPRAPVAASVQSARSHRALGEVEEGLVSRDIRLQWSGEGWRGVAWGKLVELRFPSTRRISGVVDAAPVELSVATDADGSVIRGRFAGAPAELRLSRSALVGHLGRCAYELQSDDGIEYRGHRTCRTRPEPTTVAINTLGEHPMTGGRLAPLLLLLAR